MGSATPSPGSPQFENSVNEPQAMAGTGAFVAGGQADGISGSFSFYDFFSQDERTSQNSSGPSMSCDSENTDNSSLQKNQIQASLQLMKLKEQLKEAREVNRQLKSEMKKALEDMQKLQQETGFRNDKNAEPSPELSMVLGSAGEKRQKTSGMFSNPGTNDNTLVPLRVIDSSMVSKPRVAVRIKSDASQMYDGCQWRKYGQKTAKGKSWPKAYYRCSMALECPARKQVQKHLDENGKETILISTYEGKHNHPLPAEAEVISSTINAASTTMAPISVPSTITIDTGFNANSSCSNITTSSNSMSTSSMIAFPTMSVQNHSINESQEQRQQSENISVNEVVKALIANPSLNGVVEAAVKAALHRCD